MNHPEQNIEARKLKRVTDSMVGSANGTPAARR